MSKYIKCVVLIMSLLSLVESIQKVSIDSIAFPEVEENVSIRNKNNRRPVFLPSMCPANELYYPGDQKDDWICDCRPSYIFHPKTDTCWPASQRGPCEYGYYLTLLPNSVIPECVRNPCEMDNLVVWNGKCEKLGDTAPCGREFPTKVVWVNATTLAIECIIASVESRFSEKQMETPKTNCPLGCKRFIQNKCP